MFNVSPLFSRFCLSEDYILSNQLTEVFSTAPPKAYHKAGPP